jgi:hypothetical protein
VNTKFSFDTQQIPTPLLRGIDGFAKEVGIPWQSAGYKKNQNY